MHYLRRVQHIRPQPAYPGHSKAFRRSSLIGASTGSVHMGVGLCELGARGRIDTHLHSFEDCLSG